MNNVQKHNICINEPSSQTFRSNSSCIPCVDIVVVQTNPVRLFGLAALVQWFQGSPRCSLLSLSIGWYVNRVPVSTPMRIIIHVLCSPVQNNHRTGSSWITLILRKIIAEFELSINNFAVSNFKNSLALPWMDLVNSPSRTANEKETLHLPRSCLWYAPRDNKIGRSSKCRM
jgi:hypothetical protein